MTTPLMQGWSKPIQSCRAELTWSLMFRDRYSTREIFKAGLQRSIGCLIKMLLLSIEVISVVSNVRGVTT